MKLRPSASVREMATLAYLMLSARGTLKMPVGGPTGDVSRWRRDLPNMKNVPFFSSGFLSRDWNRFHQDKRSRSRFAGDTWVAIASLCVSVEEKEKGDEEPARARVVVKVVCAQSCRRDGST